MTQKFIVGDFVMYDNNTIYDGTCEIYKTSNV